MFETGPMTPCPPPLQQMRNAAKVPGANLMQNLVQNVHLVKVLRYRVSQKSNMKN
jgi:hypothetical protein